MNDPVIKLALALTILVGGVLAAIAFRPATNAHSTAPSWAELTVLRNRRAAGQSRDTDDALDGDAVSLRPKSNASAAAPAVELGPLDNPPPVPELSPKYPGDGPSSASGFGMPLALPPEGKPQGRGPRLHKIVDGDTLAGLAAKYLGSANRATEIFAANRDVLNDPNLLPIGTELKIP